MAQFRKSMLTVGETLQSPDGPVVVTRERIQHWADAHKKLTAAKYDVPSRWEHAADTRDLLPLSTDDYQRQLDGRHVVGRMTGVDVSQDGNSAVVTLEVSDPRAAEQCDSNRIKASPVIAAWWRDGRGNEYSDLITHFDLVQRPVDANQGPFERVDSQPLIACSLEPRFLSERIIRMAMEDIAPAPEASAVEPPAPVVDTLAELRGLLAAWPTPVVLPPEVTPETLVTALTAALAVQPEPEQEEVMPVVEEPSMATLSTEVRGAVEYANSLHRKTLADRLESLVKTGRCSPAEKNQIEQQLSTVRLSLDSAGKPVSCDPQKWIECREATKENSVWEAVKLSAEPTKSPYDKPTKADIDKDVEASLTRTGFKR